VHQDRDAWTTYAQREGLLRPDPAPVPPARQKYHAIPVHVDGVRFASKREAARFQELQLMQMAGEIGELERQPVFPLIVLEAYRHGPIPSELIFPPLAHSEIGHGRGPIQMVEVAKYVGDFMYTDLRTGEIIVEDVKSNPTKTPIYRLKKKMVLAIYGIAIREV
jgi:hypothetical protein